MSDYLPEEVFINILSRLPAETLVRFTSVCKSWRSLITSPNFISHHHLLRNANDRVLIVRYRTDKPMADHYSLMEDGKYSFHQRKSLVLPFDSVGCSIVGSCNGVICLSDDLEYGYQDNIFLWNPSVRKFVALPRYNVTFKSHGPFAHCLGFGFDQVTNDFKVVRVVHTGVGCDRIPPLVELYTHKTGQWRYINKRALPLMITERCRQAYVNGAAHWMAFSRAPFRSTIVSFSMSEEVFSEILVPKSITHDNCLMEGMILVAYKDSLCLIQQGVDDSKPHYVVWIMNEYGVLASWSRLFKIDFSGGLRRPLGLRANGDVIFAIENGDFVSCDHQGKHITYLGISGSGGYWCWRTFSTDTYTESLELLNKLESAETTYLCGQKKSSSTEVEEEEEQIEAGS